MSHNLSKLVNESQQKVALIIDKFEALSGYPGEDNRLLSDVRASLRLKISDLGLDPDDTTPKELYHALLSRLEHDGRVFSSLFGHPTLSNPDKFNARLINLIELVDLPGETWALKIKVARDLLRQDPPKKLMKHLKYRSIDSMLKRENIGELYSGVSAVESSRWLNNFYHRHCSLTASDFEIRPIDLLTMPAKRWASKAGPYVSRSTQVGVVAVWPSGSDHQEHKLGSLLNVLSSLDTLKLEGLDLMIQQLKPEYGKLVYKRLLQPPTAEINMQNIAIPLNALRHHYKSTPQTENPLLQEPHMFGIDLKHSTPSNTLALLHPVFGWWKNNDTLGAVTNKSPVSLNINDVSKNFKLGQYKSMQSSNLSQALWEEVIARYLKHEAVEAKIIKSLDKHLRTTRKSQPNPSFSQKLQMELQSI